MTDNETEEIKVSVTSKPDQPAVDEDTTADDAAADADADAGSATTTTTTTTETETSEEAQS